MKKRILTALLAMITIASFAQKREIRRAGNAVEDGEYQKAMEYLNQAEAELDNADEDEKADFYLYKGYALVKDGNNIPTEDLLAAADAFKKAKELGSEEADQGITTASNALVQAAIQDQNEQKFEEASEKLLASYQLNKRDTSYLYFAAVNAVNAQNYDQALEYYQELKELGYTGIETHYIAVNKKTGEEERLPSKEQQNLFVQSGSYTDPRVEVTESREGEIAKNIALIYIQRGEEEKAIAAMEAAKEKNPDDAGLLQAEADMYYRMGDMEKYRQLMEEVVEKSPESAVSYFNLGVSSGELGEREKAIEYYKKALELDPSMTSARINLGYTILAKEEPLVKQMNQLGMSDEDTKKYEALVKEKQDLYKQALPHLLKVMENGSDNVEVARTVMNIYYQLNQPEKAEEMKAKIEEMEAAAGQPQN